MSPFLGESSPFPSIRARFLKKCCLCVTVSRSWGKDIDNWNIHIQVEWDILKQAQKADQMHWPSYVNNAWTSDFRVFKGLCTKGSLRYPPVLSIYGTVFNLLIHIYPKRNLQNSVHNHTLFFINLKNCKGYSIQHVISIDIFEIRPLYHSFK